VTRHGASVYDDTVTREVEATVAVESLGAPSPRGWSERTSWRSTPACGATRWLERSSAARSTRAAICSLAMN
jgi:hypothetical protein